MQQSGAEELKGDSRGGAEELDGFGSEGGSGRLGVTIRYEGDLELGNEDLVLGLTRDDLNTYAEMSWSWT